MRLYLSVLTPTRTIWSRLFFLRNCSQQPMLRGRTYKCLFQMCWTFCYCINKYKIKWWQKQLYITITIINLTLTSHKHLFIRHYIALGDCTSDINLRTPKRAAFVETTSVLNFSIQSSPVICKWKPFRN